MINFGKLIFDIKSSHPDTIALKIGDRSIAYDELISKAMKVASYLVALGQNGSTVGLVGHRTASTYIGCLGVLFSGANFTPLNPKYNKKRLSEIIDKANIQIFVGDLESISKLDKLGLLNKKKCILPDEILNPKYNFNQIDLISGMKSDKLSKPADMIPGAVAYVYFTSGSTGIPKGVMVSNSNLFSFLMNMSSIYKLKPGFKASQTFDMSFDPAVSDIFFTWLNKGTLCVVPENEFMMPNNFIIREKIEFWNSVPSVISFMHRTGNLRPNSFPNLRYSMFCGEQFPEYLANSWKAAAPNSTIENLYGPTEATIYISRYNYKRQNLDNNFRNGIIPIGQVFPNHDVALINDSGDLAVEGEAGEIVFSGPQITLGYLDDCKKTNQSFVGFGWDHKNQIWYKTGDLGFINSEGDLECIGRIDSQIKIAGRRIEIGEIEAVFKNINLTQEIVVVPIRDNDEIVVGLGAFVLNSLSNEDILSLRSRCSSSLDSIFFPKHFIVLSEFPLTQSGKLDRKKLERTMKEALS